ncbi:unnamed protein product [Ectocarpus fasciculatus]
MKLGERVPGVAALILLAAACSVGAGEVLVTCGSVIKLRHDTTHFHLHSHVIKWGGGSGQQSVTGHGGEDDQGSMWIVKEGDGALPCEVGQPMACGSVVRLEHVSTGRNLHSHNFKSPLTRGQEVSAFGDSGEGDGGDSWEVTCVHKGSENWARDESVKLKHVSTKKSPPPPHGSKFTQSNCPNCPIIGQTEVTCTGSASSSWKADQGIFLGATS